MKTSIHILDVSEPLFSFRDLICRCGITLHNAEMKFAAAEDVLGYLLMPVGTCRDCKALEPTGDDKRRYVYGLCEGQESMNEDEGEMLEAVA